MFYAYEFDIHLIVSGTYNDMNSIFWDVHK